MDDIIYLAVDTSNNAIMSYSLVNVTDPTGELEYVQATQAELSYLNSLEDHVLPAGSVVTMADLEDHRARIQAARAEGLKPTAKTSQPLRSATNKPTLIKPSTEKEKSKASLIGALKQFRSHK
jgi:hypothetical protein